MAAKEEPQMGLAFEQVWATIQRIAEKHEETERTIKELAEKHKELAEKHKELAEQHRKTEQTIDKMNKELAEQHKKTEQTITKMNKELNQAIGGLGNKFGELVEHLVSPNLQEKFKALGYAFGKSSPRVKYKNLDTGKVLAEVDVLLENGDCALVVEIKAEPSINDVKDHEKRMEILRAYADSLNEKRDYLGAIAGAIVNEDVKNYALKRGFYVIEQSGDTMNISATPETWKPKRWAKRNE